jgi:hypothetical protein
MVPRFDRFILSNFRIRTLGTTLHARPQLASCLGAFPPNCLLVDERRPTVLDHNAPVDDYEADIPALGDVNEIAERLHVRREVGAAEIDADEVGLLTRSRLPVS